MAASASSVSKTVVDFLGPTLIGADKKARPTEDVLKGKRFVAIYFSAHWCGPCRRMTPELASAYTKSAAAAGVEVVFCSLDRKEADFNEYYGTMPWAAVPWGAAEREKLPSDMSVMGIPQLTIISLTDGHVLKKDAGGAVAGSGSFEGHFKEEDQDTGSGAFPCTIM